MEKVQVFLDYANIDRAVRDINYEMDYKLMKVGKSLL